MSSTKRTNWRVRTTVPVTAPKAFPYAKFMHERVRGRRPGIDGGLYLVSTPDRVTRVAIVKGITGAPHLVHELDGLALGACLGRFWPSKNRLPASATSRDAVGDFDAALQFACESARVIAERVPTTTPEGPTHD